MSTRGELVLFRILWTLVFLALGVGIPLGGYLELTESRQGERVSVYLRADMSATTFSTSDTVLTAASPNPFVLVVNGKQIPSQYGSVPPGLDLRVYPEYHSIPAQTITSSSKISVSPKSKGVDVRLEARGGVLVVPAFYKPLPEWLIDFYAPPNIFGIPIAVLIPLVWVLGIVFPHFAKKHVSHVS